MKEKRRFLVSPALRGQVLDLWPDLCQFFSLWRTDTGILTSFLLDTHITTYAKAESNMPTPAFVSPRNKRIDLHIP